MVRDARAVLKRFGLAAKKSWGQNFLVDERTYGAIVAASGAAPGEWVIEIGAGLGTLTERLADAGAHVVAVERERAMIEVLHADLGRDERIEIIEANALTFDYAAVAARAKKRPIVVGNLPYQIASQILFRLLDQRAALGAIVIMLQREMADRIVAKPDTSEYGALTVAVAIRGSAKIVCKVPANAFVPAPRVTSAVVRIEPTEGTTVPVRDLGAFRSLVRAAFGQRRKTLRNAIASLGSGAILDAALAAAAIEGRRRGETLDLSEFARLADALIAAGAHFPTSVPDEDGHA